MAKPRTDSRRLTDQEVESILIDLAAKKLTQDQIALKYDTNRSSISDIATGRTFKHVKRIEPTVKRRGGQYLTLEEQVAALEREVWHLREERSHARRIAKAAVCTDGMVQHVVDCLEEVVTPIKPWPRTKFPKSKDKVEEHLVLLLSDLHMDQIVAPESVGEHERFNFKIGVRRAEFLVEEVLKYVKKTMCGYTFPVLHVLCLGDNISSPIHNHTQRSAFRNDFVNSFAVGQVMGCMIADFAQNFKQVKVLGLSGNHPRRSQRKVYPEPLDNFDYLVVREAQMFCREFKNVTFDIPDSYTKVVDVNGQRIFACHGDDLKGSHPIIALQELHGRMNLIDPTINAYVCGHFHQPGAFLLQTRNGNPIQAISNGAFVATDPYSYNSLKVCGTPSQTLFGVHKRNGITWSLPFRLPTVDESDGPKRYKIELAEAAYDDYGTRGAKKP